MGAPGIRNIAIGIVVMVAGYGLKAVFTGWGMPFLYYAVEFAGLFVLILGAMTFLKARKSALEAGTKDHLAVRNEVLMKALARMTYADTNTRPVEVEAVKRIYKRVTGVSLKEAEIRVAARGDLHESKEFNRYLSGCQKSLTAEDKVFIIKAMAEVVKADGSISPGEIEFFDQVGKAFKMNPSEIADLRK